MIYVIINNNKIELNIKKVTGIDLIKITVYFIFLHH